MEGKQNEVFIQQVFWEKEKQKIPKTDVVIRTREFLNLGILFLI